MESSLGQHQRDAAPGLLFHGLDRGERGVAGHRASIAEAEIDIAMAVDVEEVCTLRFAHEGRKCSGPLHHPVHGHAAEQRFARALEQRLRLRALVDELLLFALHEGLQAGAVDGFHDRSRITEVEL